MGFCAGLSFILARSITAPLEKLNQATEALAKGEINKRVEIDARHEVGNLARAFNNMAAMIQLPEDYDRMEADYEKFKRYLVSQHAVR